MAVAVLPAADAACPARSDILVECDALFIGPLGFLGNKLAPSSSISSWNVPDDIPALRAAGADGADGADGAALGVYDGTYGLAVPEPEEYDLPVEGGV